MQAGKAAKDTRSRQQTATPLVEWLKKALDSGNGWLKALGVCAAILWAGSEIRTSMENRITTAETRLDGIESTVESNSRRLNLLIEHLLRGRNDPATEGD